MLATYTYDVFGGVRGETGADGTPWRFTGQQRDDATGLYYLRARYYDPGSGRFLAADPAEADHPYAYAGNNPVTLVDPHGLWGPSWKSVKRTAGRVGNWAADEVGSRVGAATVAAAGFASATLYTVGAVYADYGAVKGRLTGAFAGVYAFGAYGALGGCAVGAAAGYFLGYGQAAGYLAGGFATRVVANEVKRLVGTKESSSYHGEFALPSELPAVEPNYGAYRAWGRFFGDAGWAARVWFQGGVRCRSSGH